jgi:hypothetical protein
MAARHALSDLDATLNIDFGPIQPSVADLTVVGQQGVSAIERLLETPGAGDEFMAAPNIC